MSEQEQQEPGEGGIGQSVSTGGLDETRSFLLETLDACKTKLQIYRTHSDGAYRGGMEHRALIRRIEQAHTILASNVL